MTQIQQLGVQDVYKLYEAKPADHVFIDVRQPEEWEEGVMPGAHKIMLGDLPDRLDELDKSKTYVMVCRSGGRSNHACQQMQEAGFTSLINFNGGMLAWNEAGYETE